MQRDQIEQKLIDIVCAQMGVDQDRVKLETSFIDEFGADSLDLVELLMAVEDEFHVEISDDEAEEFKTVKDVVDYLEKKVR